MVTLGTFAVFMACYCIMNQGNQHHDAETGSVHDELELLIHESFGRHYAEVIVGDHEDETANNSPPEHEV